MKNKIINPFQYLRGIHALLFGLAGIILASFLSIYTKTHLDGVLDIHYAGQGEFGIFLLENLFSWISLIISFGIIGYFIRGRSFRIEGLSGYTAFIRLPLILAVILPWFLDGSAVADFIIYKFLNLGEPVNLTTSDIISFILLALLTIFIIFWMLSWGYFAFCTLFNIKGLKAGTLYFASILLAEIIAKVFLVFVLDISLIQV